LHEKWSEFVTGSKDGLPFDPDNPAYTGSVEMPPITHAFGKKGYEIHVRSGVYYAAFSSMNTDICRPTGNSVSAFTSLTTEDKCVSADSAKPFRGHTA